MANENELNIRFKVNDDGSVVLDKIGQNIGKVETHAKSMQDSLSIIKYDSLINIGEKAFAAAQKFYEFAEAGAKVRSIEDSFAIMAGNAGISIDRLTSKLKQATDGAVSTSEMMIKATRLISESFSSGQIVQIGEAARISARLMGTTVTGAYDEIADSIVNLRERGLKTAGFVIDLDAAYRKHAETLGVAKEDLNQYGKQMALVNAVAEKAAELHDKLGISVETASEKMQKSKSSWKDFLDTISKAASKTWELIGTLDKLAGGAIAKAAGPVAIAAYGAVKGGTVEGPEAAVELANREARAAGSVKSQIDEDAILKRHAEDLNRNREVDAELLKDQEATLRKILELQEKLNKSSEDAVAIAEKLGVGTKASLTQWIEKDIVGEYKKVLGSGLFSPDELEQMQEKYITALENAMTKKGGWESESRQIEGAIKRIKTLKPEETDEGKMKAELERQVKFETYLRQQMEKQVQEVRGPEKIKIDTSEFDSARSAIKQLRADLDALDQGVTIPVTISIVGGGKELGQTDIERIEDELGTRFQNKRSRLNTIVQKQIEGGGVEYSNY